MINLMLNIYINLLISTCSLSDINLNVDDSISLNLVKIFISKLMQQAQ